MSRKKNKPNKNAAEVSPAGIPTGTTEVIVGAGATAVAATAVAPAAEPVQTSADNTGEVEKTVASEPVAPADEATTAPAADVAAATAPADNEPAATQEPAKESVSTPAQPAPQRQGGFLNYLRSFFISDVGMAIHR
jgi:hypothetical protein